MVGFEQFEASGRIAHVTLFEEQFFRFQENSHHFAIEAAGLGEEEDFPGHQFDPFYASKYSISAVIFAVFSSMAETEQYFSFERRTASSTALRDTLPPTR